VIGSLLRQKSLIAQYVFPKLKCESDIKSSIYRF